MMKFLNHIVYFFKALLVSIVASALFAFLALGGSVIMGLVLHACGVNIGFLGPVVIVGAAIAGFVGAFAGCYGKTVFGFSVRPAVVDAMLSGAAKGL